jgi:hypothetical protein
MKFKYLYKFYKILNVENNIICFIYNVFFLKIVFIITKKYNRTCIPFLLIRYFFKGGEILYLHTYIQTYKNIYHDD